jgi:hypothetical protein
VGGGEGEKARRWRGVGEESAILVSEAAVLCVLGCCR